MRFQDCARSCLERISIVLQGMVFMNGFIDILANCIVDEDTCVRWTDMLFTLLTQQTRDDHAKRIRRMMCVLYYQGYSRRVV